MLRQYMRPAEIAEELGISERHVRDLANEMRDYIPTRYKLTDFFGSGKSLAVRFTAIQDYSLHREAIRNKRPCPDYNPTIVEQDLGISQLSGSKVALTNEDLKQLAGYITSAFGTRLAIGGQS